MYGEFYYSEGPYSGEANTEIETPEFEDDWATVSCEADIEWTPVEC